jgi:NitT/TauT family transport system permease protein
MTGTARVRAVALAAAVPVMALAAWELVAATAGARRAFFPRPSVVAAHLVALVADGTLADHGAATLSRLAWAFALAAVPGVVLGLAMGVSRRLHDALDPLFAALYPIPSVLFLPLVSFVAPGPEAALAATAAFTSFFLIVHSTATGVQQIDRGVLDAATHYGARRARLFRAVLLPGALPRGSSCASRTCTPRSSRSPSSAPC